MLNQAEYFRLVLSFLSRFVSVTSKVIELHLNLKIQCVLFLCCLSFLICGRLRMKNTKAAGKFQETVKQIAAILSASDLQTLNIIFNEVNI